MKRLRSLSIGTKLLLIAGASLLPLGLTLTLWLTETRGKIDAVEREREGLALHVTLKNVLVPLVRHRDLAVKARLAERTSDPALTTAGADVQKALAAAAAQAGTVPWAGEIATGLVDMSTAWEIVRRSVENRPPEETWLEHNELIALNLLPRFAQVGRQTGLLVDSDPTTFYLGRLVLERLPNLATRLGELASLTEMIDKRTAAGIIEVDRLQVAGALAQADVDALDVDVKSLGRVGNEVAAPVTPAFGVLDQGANRFLRTLDSSVRSARAGRPDWPAAREVPVPVDKAFEAYDRGTQAMGARLGEHLAELSTRRNLLLAVTLAVVGFALGLGFLLMRSITNALTGALRVADRVASGDLSKAVEVRGSDETAKLMMALRSMNTALAKMVGEVRQAADSIANESRSLAGGNRDLSERTESQASAIEEAASSMEELTASVRQNMDSARETLRLTTQASEATTRGMEAASRVVDHMESIKVGTKRVGEIVGMIDAIAFQTNILALNAAVEAARAGEHGRGFAVVAAEVRNLSRRCADSAREIKGLVVTASSQVSDGSRLVDEVANSIGDINQRVAEVDTLMNGIVAASVEQSSGIDQVGQTITQMERVTQQNAAMVEEILAATESLSRQTSRLTSLVGAFRLGSDAPAAGAEPVSVKAVLEKARTGKAPAPILEKAARRRLPQR